ncbi:MAG: hypothetical protein R3F42_06875 [Pseudomonadota bacterium]
MRLEISWYRHALLALALTCAGNALACDHAFDGCLGCNDDQLPICLQEFVASICETSGNPANCDTERAYDDVERHVIISTGTHMSKVRAMMRSARKYQLH